MCNRSKVDKYGGLHTMASILFYCCSLWKASSTQCKAHTVHIVLKPRVSSFPVISEQRLEFAVPPPHPNHRAIWKGGVENDTPHPRRVSDERKWCWDGHITQGSICPVPRMRAQRPMWDLELAWVQNHVIQSLVLHAGEGRCMDATNTGRYVSNHESASSCTSSMLASKHGA